MPKIHLPANMLAAVQFPTEYARSYLLYFPELFVFRFWRCDCNNLCVVQVNCAGLDHRTTMFRISIEQTCSEERWIIQGRLVAAFAGELDAAWNSSLEKNPLLSRVVDLCGVVLIDRRGQEVLRKMLRQDAEFIAPGVYTRHILEQLRARLEIPSRS